MKIALCQINPTVGDFEGNRGLVARALDAVSAERPDLAVFPEMCLPGYPPRDLLEHEWFVRAAERSLERLAEVSRTHPGTAVLVGTVTRSSRAAGKGLHNSAVLLRAGEIVAVRHKTLLPSYDVFDEGRYFDPAEANDPVPLGDERLGVTVCEDAWNDPELWPRPIYEADPVADLAADGATLFVNIAASPFYLGKVGIRRRLFGAHALRHASPFVTVNQVGGNDELIFDGASLAFTGEGTRAAQLPMFEEATVVVDPDAPVGGDPASPDPIEQVAQALVLGLSDYVRKCGFEKAVLGLSGGIDSAVVCALAARALGPENVLAVTMPSAYSSEGSVTDSEALAENLGVRLVGIPIWDIYDTYRESLRPLLIGDEIGVTEENIQARIRGNILMAVSNEHGHLLLATGNKSELSVGYCTLYGDMSGGLGVIADVPKTMVYELARHMNREREVIPGAIIDKAPSAELRPGQCDQDSLPPYETLDRILELSIDEGRSTEEIVAEGFDAGTVRWVLGAIAATEYKRRQAAPGLKVTSKAFGTGRRMPIAARYGDETEAPA